MSFFGRYVGLFGGGGGGGGGVTSLNTETGDITLVGGTNVTITPLGKNITIDASSGTAATSIGALDAQAANANGLALVSNVLSAQSADATHPGLVNNTTQTFSGAKTFSSAVQVPTANATTPSVYLPTGGGNAGFYFGGGGFTFAYNTADVFSFISSQIRSNVQLQMFLNTDVNTPGIYFLTEGNTGFYRIGANNWGFTASGSKILDIGSSGLGVTGTLTATGAATLSNYGAGVAQLSSAGLISSTAPGSSGNILTSNGTAWISAAPATSGTVTAVSVVSANGLAGSSSGGATPALTLSTTITGVLKGNGTAISAATAGTDYSAGTSALSTGILKSTTTTGALTIAASGTDYQAPISSTTPVSHQFLTGFTSPNTFAQAQPAFTDISGTATVAQVTIATQAISSTAIDWSTGSVFTQSNGATSRIFTFSNQTSGQTIVVRLTQTSGTVTWPSVKWSGGVAPTATASGTDVYTFVYDGTSTYGSAVQNMS